MAEAFPTTPSVGDKVTASQGAVLAKDAVIADCGTVTITPVANTPTSTTVNFNKTFPSVPKVQVTFNGSAAAITNVSYTNATTTTVDVVVTRTNTTSSTLCWFAVLTH